MGGSELTSQSDDRRIHGWTVKEVEHNYFGKSVPTVICQYGSSVKTIRKQLSYFYLQDPWEPWMHWFRDLMKQGKLVYRYMPCLDHDHTRVTTWQPPYYGGQNTELWLF